MFEQVMIKSGIILLKCWPEVSPEEQTRRLKARFGEAKTWKLSLLDRRTTAMIGQAIPFRDSRRLPGFPTRFIGTPSLALRVRGLRLDPQMLGILRQPAPDCSASAPARAACQAKTAGSPRAPLG